jgi:hypothetical protein
MKNMLFTRNNREFTLHLNFIVENYSIQKQTNVRLEATPFKGRSKLVCY